MRTQIIRGAAATALALTVGMGLTACGDSGGSTSGSASGTTTATNGDVFNDADVQFATDMIQHHAQAVQMVVLTEGRPLDPGVTQLADGIRAAQVPEIEQMVDWLTAWGQKVPETSMDHANAGHDMDDMEGMEGADGMPGMMSADDMTALEDASDVEFQDMWLEMMIDHHQGAVEMAVTEQKHGANDDAESLADSIISTQQEEITTMEGLLG